MKSLHLVEPQQPALADVVPPCPIEQGPASTAHSERRTPAVRFKVRKVSGRLGAVRNAEVLNLSLSGFATTASGTPVLAAAIDTSSQFPMWPETRITPRPRKRRPNRALSE